MTVPEGGWLGLMVLVAQESKSEEEFNEKLAMQLEKHEADGDVRELLGKYDWNDAKQVALRAPPNYRISVERGLLLKRRK
jgi:hypothetical protein